MNSIKKYVSRQLIEQAKILRLSAYNQEGDKNPKRNFYYRISNHIDNFINKKNELRWITVPGLRGVGKTTVLAQLFFDYQENFNGRILYISLDDVVNKLGGDLFSVLDAYEELVGESFSSLSQDILLLVDEAHFDPKWQLALKSLHDKSRRIFIISTGSSAIAINRTADVARRSLVERIYPLKLTEYIMLTNPKSKASLSSEKIAQALFEGNSASDVYSRLKLLEPKIISYWQENDIKILDRYIRYYSLPSVVSYTEDVAIYKVLNSVVDRIIGKDLLLTKSFSLPVLEKIPPLLFLVASSDTRSIGSFARDLKDINEKTLISVFRALEDAELFLRIYPFSLSAPKKVRRPSKYLFLAPSIRAALIHFTDSRAIDMHHKGKLLEDSIGMYLYCHFVDIIGSSFGYDDSRGGADFIIDSQGRRIVIETGWNKKDVNQVVRTMISVKADYGLIITNSSSLEIKGNIVIVPFEFFFAQ